MWLPMYVLLAHILTTTAGADVQPSIITTQNNDYFGYMDKFSGFNCEASGSNLKYTWKHKDILITEAYLLKFPTVNASTLQPIKDNLNLGYEGTYQCFAENSIGRIFGRKATVKFTAVGKFKLPKTETRVHDVTVGETLALHCPEHGYSYNVKYHWQYQEGGIGIALPSDPHYFVTKNGTLHFSTVTEADIKWIEKKEGIQCRQIADVTDDEQSRSWTSHKIKLRKNPRRPVVANKLFKPDIKTVIGTKSVFFGAKHAFLKCGAIGNPVPTLKWFKLDETDTRTEIKGSDEYKLQSSNQYLSISEVNSNKAGRYVCEASNSLGKTAANGKIIVAERPQWRVGGELTNQQPPLKRKFIWECGALGGPTYAWFKNGEQLVESSSSLVKIKIDKTSDGKSRLTFNEITKANNGMYQCVASNEKDVIYSTGRLEVNEKKPEFTEDMGPVTLIEGRRGVISCPVLASPLPTITWRRNSLKLVYNKRIKLADNELDLVIFNVTKADRGIYLCHAKTDLGTAEDSSNVTVGGDIIFLAAPVSNRNVTVTLRYELDCHAAGDPNYEVKYRWLRNGLPLEYSARIHWVKDDHRLVILDAIVSDTGTYTCITFAETPHYIEKRMDAEIVVKGPANPPDIVRVLPDCWTGTAQLTWKLGALNNEEVYEYWIDWSTRYDPGNWTRLPKVLEEDPHPVNLNFDLLPPFSQISFRVTVFNRIGHSSPSIPTNPSACLTKPSAPPHSPAKIEGTAGGPNTLTLVWTPVPQTYWGAPGFNYTLQFRRKTEDDDEDRWGRIMTRIYDGTRNSFVIKNPGTYNEWEFRIRSNNHYGSSPTWTVGEGFSGQNPPEAKTTGLTTNTISARSAEIAWRKVPVPPKQNNGSIEGYTIEYWHSVIGVHVTYDNSRRNKRDVSDVSQQKNRRRKRNAKDNVSHEKNKRTKRDDDEEEEEEVEHCFDPAHPCLRTAPESETLLTNLQPYKTYHIRIAAYNSGGRGPWSNELPFETAEATPGEPYAVNAFAYGQYCKVTWKEPRHTNGKILEYEIYGKGIVRRSLPWWMRRYIVYNLEFLGNYEVKLRARNSAGWGEPLFRWFNTTRKQKPAKPLVPEVVGYGDDGVNVTFMEPKPILLRKYGGEMDEDPWELRPVGGFEMEHHGDGGYPETFVVRYRKAGSHGKFEETRKTMMYSEREQTWIIIEDLDRFTLYEFATVPTNKQGEGPWSDFAIGLPGGIVPKVKKLHWYQRDWFIALCVLFGAASILFIVILLSTKHLKSIYYEGAPKRRKDRERERIYEPEDVDGGFNEFTLKSARSSRSVVTSRSGPPPPYSVTNGSTSRHSGDFDEDVDSDDDEKNEVSTYYSDEKKVPLDDYDEEEEDSNLATFV